jgi:hypothetical protein
MRFYGGLSLEETAEALKISTRRSATRMKSGEARLYCELSRGG